MRDILPTMKQAILLLFVILSCHTNVAQVKGTITDESGNPIPAVAISIENAYIGTSSNEQGQYLLRVKRASKYILVFQSLGYKTKKIKYNIELYTQTLNVQLVQENITLNEVVVSKKTNPANAIIRNAIANKTENSEKTAQYEADFYSRGIFRLKDAPKKILGQKFDNFDEILDSTRSGILYLSETVSKIKFKKPDKLKETIVASKISGKDNGFSFNNAASANFDFYENYLPFDVNVISPLANNAFNYYKYQLEGSFFDDNKHEINKIKVTSLRDSEPVMEGYLYIIEDSWAIYAVDLTVKGSQIQNPALNTLTLKQNFNYNSNTKIWTKNIQTLDFNAGIFGVKISGKFTYVYSNYVFEPKFNKKTFNREILSFEANANKKEDDFWNKIRPVPLTDEETIDYVKKNKLQIKKKSKIYLDSIDAKSNTFSVTDLVFGYSYKNSFRKWALNYSGLVTGIGYNTVQGWKLKTGFSFTKSDREKRTFSAVKTFFDYGISEKKIRVSGEFTHKFDATNQSELKLAGGSSVAQINSNNPISALVNTVSSLFFKDNYMKLYEKNYAALSFKREIVNGISLKTDLDYSERKPLYNTTDFSIIKKEVPFTSNNPLAPNEAEIPVIEKHNLAKFNIGFRINFAQEYWTRPDGKFNIRNEKYPTLLFNYEKGFAASDTKFEFDHLNSSLIYDVTIGNKGNLAMNLKAGKFFNAASISFVDFKHFNGNQTHIGTENQYLNAFNLLPYYSSSTNNAYFEAHLEHDDKGYIMNKIPFLNLLKSNLVLGFHNLSVPNFKSYQEITLGLTNLGFGKFKLLRLDYVRSYQGGFKGDGIILGLTFLNFLE